MLVPDHDFQSAEDVLAEAVGINHVINCIADNFVRLGFHAVRQFLGVESARVAGEAVVFLLIELAAGELHFFGVLYNHEITDIHVRGKSHLMLAAQDGRHASGQAAQGELGRIGFIPGALDIFSLRNKCLGRVVHK